MSIQSLQEKAKIFESEFSSIQSRLKDLENKEIQKANLEKDISILLTEKTSLLNDVKNLDGKIKAKVAEAIVPALKEVEELKDSVLAERESAKRETSYAAQSKGQYENLSRKVEESIKLNQKHSKSLEEKGKEISLTKERLKNALTIIQGVLDE